VGGRERRRRLREQEKGNQACCLWEKSRRSYMQDCSANCTLLTIGTPQAPGARCPSSTNWPSSIHAYKANTNLSNSVVIPCIVLAGVNAYRLWTEHWEHVAHGPALEDKPEYPFQNIRTKNYFWGDGDKVRYTTQQSDTSVRQLTPDVDPLLEPQGQLPQEGRVKNTLG
jgi:hypothetical protein